MFVEGFIQKTIKVDLFVKVNHVYPRRKQLKKILEDSALKIGSISADSGTAGPTPRPAGQVGHMSASPFYVGFPPP